MASPSDFLSPADYANIVGNASYIAGGNGTQQMSLAYKAAGSFFEVGRTMAGKVVVVITDYYE